MNDQAREVQIPITRTITYVNCQLQVARTPDGGRVLQIVDPGSQTIHQVSLTPEGAREIGNELFSAVPVAGADQMPGGEKG